VAERAGRYPILVERLPSSTFSSPFLPLFLLSTSVGVLRNGGISERSPLVGFASFLFSASKKLLAAVFLSFYSLFPV